MNQKGFTLLEVMIALLIFGVVMTGMAPAFAAQMKRNTESQIRTEAISAAQMVLDGLRLQDPASLPHSGSTAAQNITIGSRAYSVVATYCQTAAYCASPNNRHITITVTHKAKNVFTTETVFTQLR